MTPTEAVAASRSAAMAAARSVNMLTPSTAVCFVKPGRRYTKSARLPARPGMRPEAFSHVHPASLMRRHFRDSSSWRWALRADADEDREGRLAAFPFPFPPVDDEGDREEVDDLSRRSCRPLLAGVSQ